MEKHIKLERVSRLIATFAFVAQMGKLPVQSNFAYNQVLMALLSVVIIGANITIKAIISDKIAIYVAVLVKTSSGVLESVVTQKDVIIKEKSTDTEKYSMTIATDALALVTMSSGAPKKLVHQKQPNLRERFAVEKDTNAILCFMY